VLSELSISVGTGEVVALLGHNGAGKTTTLRSAFGSLPLRGGRVHFAGSDVTGSCSPRRNVRRGMALIPSERFVFGELSVTENLRLGALHTPAPQARERRAFVLEMFPILGERGGQRAGTLSGGQQRMLSLGIALMSRPKLLLLDEPSLGLAPALVQTIFGQIRRLATEDGIGVLLVEQNVNQALRAADRVAIMRSGRVLREEPAAATAARPPEEWWTLF
jgi:branched-chain amino acid transport system ATP-binding protein